MGLDGTTVGNTVEFISLRFFLLLFMYTGVSSTHVHIYHVHTWYHQKSDKDIICPGPGVTDWREPHVGPRNYANISVGEAIVFHH